MTEWLLSGHNTQETTGVATPLTLSMTQSGLDNQITWFLTELAGDISHFDASLRPTAVVQGHLYLNINYYVRNMASVLPFDPESVGAPSDLLEVETKPTVWRMMGLPVNFRRVYRWASHYYTEILPQEAQHFQDVYWHLRTGEGDLLSLIWDLFEEEYYQEMRKPARAHIVAALTITSLDGVLRKQAPGLLGLFVGHETATSQMGQRIWELRQVAQRSGPRVAHLLRDGVVELGAYAGLSEAEELVAGVQAFLREYGHRGFRYESDVETERLADRPEQILMAIAGQMREGTAPVQRADAARSAAEEKLQAMNPVKRAVWSRVLRWGQRLISWREQSKSFLALQQATYGQAALHLGRHFYPEHPEDTLMFYTKDELLAFVRTRGEERVDYELLQRRRTNLELHQTQNPPPELIWYNPETHHWHSALPGEEEREGGEVEGRPVFKGIPASAGPGPAEGVAVITNDPFIAGRRILELDQPVILVTHLTDPAWSSLFGGLAGVVTELGGVISHAAIVARENGLPAVVGVPQITRQVRNGQRLRINGATGVVEVLE